MIIIWYSAFDILCSAICNKTIIIIELNEFEKWSSHLLYNLSDCLISAPEKFQVASVGLKPMSSAMLVQCSYQLSYETTPMCSGERNYEWDFSFKKSICPSSLYHVMSIDSSMNIVIANQ